MPTETQQAVNWALDQDYYGIKIRDAYANDNGALVDKVREYFNKNSIEYGTFSYDDLLPFLN